MTFSRWSSRTAYSHVYYHSQSSRYHSQTVAAGAPAERPLSVKDLPRANNTKDRDTWPTRQSLGTPHIYKHMVKMYSAGVDGHQMSGIVLSHTAASSEGIQHNCRPHLSRGGVGDQTSSLPTRGPEKVFMHSTRAMRLLLLHGGFIGRPKRAEAVEQKTRSGERALRLTSPLPRIGVSGISTVAAGQDCSHSHSVGVRDDCAVMQITST